MQFSWKTFLFPGAARKFFVWSENVFTPKNVHGEISPGSLSLFSYFPIWERLQRAVVRWGDGGNNTNLNTSQTFYSWKVFFSEFDSFLNAIKGQYRSFHRTQNHRRLPWAG